MEILNLIGIWTVFFTMMKEMQYVQNLQKIIYLDVGKQVKLFKKDA